MRMDLCEPRYPKGEIKYPTGMTPALGVPGEERERPYHPPKYSPAPRADAPHSVQSNKHTEALAHHLSACP